MTIKLLYTYFWLWRSNRLWPWIEALVITVLFLGLCYLIHPNNPLFVHAIFPWPWLAAIIIVLQYGAGPSSVSFGIIFIIAVLLKNSGTLSITDFQGYMLSGLTLILTSALFSSSWVRRTINAEELLSYSDERLNSLSRSYYMLRISYDHLEQNIITKPQTLRLVMEDLQKIAISNKGILTTDIAYRFLQLLTQYCSINVAGIYPYNNGKISIKPLAEIGSNGLLDLQDPLISYALDLKEMCYISINQIESIEECKYLVAMPMITSEGDFIGLFVIKEMSFWALTNETLQVLSMLIAYFIEETAADANTSHFIDSYPGCTIDFAKQLAKLLRLKKDLNIDSAFTTIIVPRALRHHNIIANLEKQRRFLDAIWLIETEDMDMLITLMPFTNATGIQGFFNRITTYLNSELGLTFAKEQIKMRSMQLYSATPEAIMAYYLNFIEVPKTYYQV